MKHYIFMDVSPVRSKTMRAIRSKNTGIELALRQALFARGLRYRLYYKDLPGKPDIVFPRHRIAVFCDSDFWHGKSWRTKKKKLRSNREYWIEKIENNIRRDKDVNKNLRKRGWKVFRFWERDILENLQELVNIIENEVKRQKQE